MNKWFGTSTTSPPISYFSKQQLSVEGFVLAVSMLLVPAHAQENHHPPQDQELHAQFYSNWMRPDSPELSCCGKGDCYPTEIRIEDSKVYAQRREDGKFIFVPNAKVEQNRSSPGCNHLCAPYNKDDQIYCFIFGGGL